MKELRFHYPLQNDPKSSAASEIEMRKAQDRKFLKKAIVAGILFGVWQGIWIPTQMERNNQREATLQHAAFIKGYDNGWDDQCAAIFSRLGGVGNLAFGQGISITFPQCLTLKVPTAAEDSFKENIGGYIRNSSEMEMLDAGRNFADSDSLARMFAISPYWCFRAECVTEKTFGILRPD
jgi:hypothetical protein